MRDNATAALKPKLPASFVWGAASASHQLEGAWNEDGRLPKDGRTGNPGNNPVIINEYSYLWINRDGSLPTLCFENPVLEKVGSSNDSPVEHRRDAMSYGIACLTGFWRMHRTVAGVMHFCSLTYSLPHGQTCDNFIDLEKLELEPTFARLVRASFAPVAAILDNWGRPHCAGHPYTGHVVVLNDLTVPWNGEVWLRLRRREDRTLLAETSRHASVSALGVERFSLTLPGPTKPGDYLIEADLLGPDGECVTCERRFEVPERLGAASGAETIHVDYQTFKRPPKLSAAFYRSVIQQP